MKKSVLIFFWIFGFILNAYSQEDSIKTSLKTFKLINNYSNFIECKVDSRLDNLQIYNPIFKKEFSFSYTGNIASPYISDIFYKRNLGSDFYLIDPYLYYFKAPDEINYYTVNTPFTSIEYVTNFGSKDVSETTVEVIHTQNFGSLNVGFDIHHLNGKGQYERQETTNGNGTLFAHYDGLHYELFANTNITNLLIEQNGGIEDSSFRETEAPMPKLSYADSEIRNRSFQITQKYRIGLKVDTLKSKKMSVAAFAHTMSYIQNKRSYTDDLADENVDYYDTAFYYTTFDTSYYRNLTNQFRFEVYEAENSLFSVHGHVGLKMENIRQFSTTSDTTDSFVASKLLHTTNLSLIWNLGQDKKHYSWNVNGGYYFSGYRQFDILFNSNIAFKVLDYELVGYYNFKNVEPDFFFKRYQSNHYNWENSFNKIQINDLGATLASEKYNFKAQVNNRLVTGYIYFNEGALPEQANSKVVNVLSIEAEKTFRLGVLVFEGKGIYQQSNSNKYLSVPKLTFYSSLYIDYVLHFKLTGGELAFQLGTDFYYRNKFYGYNYNPVFEQFYLQSEKKIGGNPYISPFLNIQIKTVRFFIKYDHANQLIMNQKDYYSLIDYPRDPNNVKFGLFWNFYD